jgi:hypothetical protein
MEKLLSAPRGVVAESEAESLRFYKRKLTKVFPEVKRALLSPGAHKPFLKRRSESARARPKKAERSGPPEASLEIAVDF